ncbi:MAG: RNA ligase family protein [Pseudomonadota bacterium]
MTNFIQNLELFKYPSTQHLEGSQLQKGDQPAPRSGKHSDPRASYAVLAGRHIVVEEKLDGANAGVSFSPGGELLLQSRGHYLMGGGRERQFGLFKRWANVHDDALLACLDERYVMYGEWMGKKHSVFYDRLPHLFCEFDIYDRSRAVFLSTSARKQLIGCAPVLPVPVLFAGTAPSRLDDLLALLQPSLAKSAHWRNAFEETVAREGLDLGKCWGQADKSDLAEGLYIKVEDDAVVTARYKWVRSDFVQAILDSQVHHSQQAFVPNELAPGADIYAPQLTMHWDDLKGKAS